MNKQTKQQSNYRLPIQCCASCVHSGQNDYGDNICTVHEAGNTIDAGAICDLYKDWNEE